LRGCIEVEIRDSNTTADTELGAGVTSAPPRGRRGLLRGPVLLRAALIFLPLAAIAAAVLFLLYRSQAETLIASTEIDEDRRIDAAHRIMSDDLAAAAAQLRFFSSYETLRYWLANRDSIARELVRADFLVFARTAPMYDQVRLIGSDGRELIRVVNRGGVAMLVPEAELEDAGDRDYVREAFALGPGQIHVSPFELSVERGVIEEPIKPTIRFAAPVFAADGRRQSVIVINYVGHYLFERMRTLASADSNIWLLNADGYWLRGPAAADEWAFMYPERRGRTVERLYPEAWRAIAAGRLRGQFYAGGSLFTYARLMPPGTGEWRWIVLGHVSAASMAALTAPLRRTMLLMGAASAVLFVGIAFAVAQLWQTRMEAQGVVRANEARFRNLLESAPDAVLVTDADGHILIANAEVERMFGYRREELVGRRVEMLIPERLRGGHVRHRTQYAAEPRARTMGAGLALVGRRKDGSEVPVAVSLSPSATAEGTLIFCDIRDVSDQRAAVEQIRELNERLGRDNAELAAVNEELEAFSYSVSHDLRAPLRAIDGFSQALIEDYADKLDAGGRDYASRVRNAAQRMGHLIDDLLKLARVTRAELAISDVDLSALAREIADALAKGEPGRQASFEIAPGLGARGDQRLLRIALENLLGNAWKFSAGARPARIEVGQVPDGEARPFFVRDNGAGFDMTYAGKLFGAFQRLHDAREFPGTGIGLATVQRIVHKHGGRVWAESAPGRGATFYFTL
jgi:PAS domain S-box-containing protein